MLNKNYLLLLFIFISLLCTNIIDAQTTPRWVSLKKTGGTSTLALTGLTLASGYTLSTALDEIKWQESTPGLPIVSNWTAILKSIFQIVNADAQNQTSGVSFLIKISAPDPGNPMMVGEQIIDYGLNHSLWLAIGEQILVFVNADNITIEGVGGKAHLKYIDDYYYGSWLLPGQTSNFHYFEYENYPGSTSWYLSTWDPTIPSSGNPWNASNVVLGTLSAFPVTNTYSVLKSINDFKPNPNVKYNYIEDRELFAYLQDMIQFEGCKNVIVKGLDIDGNLSMVKMGGPAKDDGVQLRPTGITVRDSKNVLIEDVNAHHFPFDGIEVSGDASNNIEIRNSKFEYNGRQGISWTGGKNVLVEYCEFNNTGRAIVNGFGSFVSSPGAGLDLEPEDIADLENGHFKNCRFINNVGQAVLNPQLGNGLTAKTMTFEDCTFWGEEGGLWCLGRKFTFAKCSIWCPVVHLMNEIYPLSDAIIFNDCDFEDTPNPDNPSQYWTTTPYALLSETGHGKGTQFNNCNFKANRAGLGLFYLLPWATASNLDEYTHFNNCNYTFNNAASAGSISNASRLKYATFKGNNYFENTSSVGSAHSIKLTDIQIYGSDDPCEPAVLSVDGKIQFDFDANPGNFFCVGLHPTNNSHEGYADVTVKKDALFSFETGNFSSITCNDIHENSRLIIEEDGAFSYRSGPGSISYLGVQGKLIAKPNSYFCAKHFGFERESTSASTSLMYIDNTSINGENPLWTGIIGASPDCGTGLPLLGNVLTGGSVPVNCVQGGHSVVAGTTFSCTPVYNNISTDGAFSILYNTKNVSCNGGNDGELIYQIKGGTAPYVSSISNLNALSAGQYTVTFTDANSCTADVEFEITQPVDPLSWNSTSFTNITCNNSNNGIIDVIAIGGNGIINYSMNGGPLQSTGNYVNLSNGVYTITAVDANACTVTTIIAIINPPLLAFSSSNFNNILCNTSNTGTITSTAIGGTGSLSYSLNGGLAQSTGNFSNLGTGTYIVEVSDANSCTASVTFIINAPTIDHCCTNPSPTSGSNIVSTTNLILLNNPTANDVITNYNANNPVVSNKIFYIDGTFEIDDDITFVACTLYFAPNSYVQLTNSHTLYINNSILQASCDYWGGIVLNNVSQKLKTSNNTIIKDAFVGVNVSKDALVEIKDSHFENNAYVGIAFSDMNTLNYGGVVERNTFTSNTAMIAPYTKGNVGISVRNVARLNIGDIMDGGSGNDFTNIETGILVANTYNTPPPTSHIGIYNNTFDNIRNTNISGGYIEAQKINNCYNGINVWTPVGYPPIMICSDTGPGFAGAAIFAKNDVSNLLDALIDVRNTSNANPNLSIQNCDKAIVSIRSSVTAEKLYIDNCLMGIMNDEIVAMKFVVHNNIINNGFIGMQFNGESDNSSVIGNTISCSLFPSGVPTSSSIGASYIWPKGIELNRYLNTGADLFDIVGNTISLPHYAGLGISLNNTGSGVAAKDNTINLGTTDGGTIACIGSTILAGIASNIALGTRIHRNEINGNTANAASANDVLGRVDAAGILINDGEEQAIGCNSINNTRFGLLAWGQNNSTTTADLKVQGNTVLGSDAGWVFRHLANEGSLGNVGNLANDNNNVFGSLTTSAKVFKFCMGLLPSEFIFTISINQLSESKSENMNTYLDDCPYQITPNPGAIVFNNNPIGADCGGLQMGTINDDILIDEALAIATNTKEYAEFPVLAHWYDSKRLYNYLSGNLALLNSYAELLTFYTAMTDDAIAQERLVDIKLAQLIADFATYSPAQREGELQDAGDVNDDIEITETQNYNERMMNTLYIKMMRTGMNSFTESEREFISTLAPQCPYIGGSAVYKARNLNYHLAPDAQYDDMKACNAVGVYRQSGSGNTNSHQTSLISMEDEVLSHIRPLQNKLLQNDIMVYPNPANDYIEVSYKSEVDATFRMYNALGQIILVQRLLNENTKQIIRLSNLANGIYHYEIEFANRLKSIGKITKTN